MTPPHPTPAPTHQPSKHKRVLCWLRLAARLLGPALLVAGLAVGSGVLVDEVAAQSTNTTLNETAPYYANETALENQSGWYPNGSNVSLDVLGELGGRLGTYVIGTGNQIPGGTTYAGTIITGLVMTAVFLGAVAFTSIGSTGGVVVAATVGYGLTSIGLAPSWLKIVLLLLIGLVAAFAALRVTQ